MPLFFSRYELVFRHPFPGPGLGVRILGEVTRERAELLRRADAIFIEELRRAGWYERSIDTADRTQQLHDFSLRFPTPYRDVVSNYARQLDLDEAWIYGLVRQESRFSADARSSAGAVGLMQLMPTTARFALGSP